MKLLKKDADQCIRSTCRLAVLCYRRTAHSDPALRFPTPGFDAVEQPGAAVSRAVERFAEQRASRRWL